MKISLEKGKRAYLFGPTPSDNQYNNIFSFMLQILFAEEEQKSEQGQGLLDKAAGIFSSISRMMKSI